MRLSRPTRLDGGIFLVSFAVLLVELLLTRIFSVTMYYHLSFVVVSLAMLGFGASGLLLNLRPALFRPQNFQRQLAAGGVLFALTAVLVVGVAFYLPVPLALSKGNLLRLGLIFLLCVVPFLMGGLVVALILTHRTEQAHRLYFADLAGAALACLLFIPVTNLLGAPTGVLLAASVGAAAGVVFAGREAPQMRRAALALCVLLVVAAALNARLNFYDVRVVKGKTQPPLLALEWNSFSRVEVVGRPEDMTRLHPPRGAGYSERMPPELLTTELFLRYDADAATELTRFDRDLNRLAYLRYDVASAPYQLRRYENVLVLGAGGGRDLLTALLMGNRRLTGVEINPVTVKLLRGRFRQYTGGIYDNFPGVSIVNDEGRNFLRSRDERYDLIQASLVDTWAATSAGAYALTENNLYTVEAFQDYLRHLAPDGVLSFSRWFTSPPVEPLRVVTLAAEALRREGVADPSAHVFVLRTTGRPGHVLGTILVKRSPFAREEIATLRGWAEQMNFPIAYAPDDRERGAETNEFHRLFDSRSAEFIKDYPYDISAVYDDRPFFFDRVPLVAWAAHRLGFAGAGLGRGEMTLGGQSLLVALVVSAFFTAALLLLPFALLRRAPDAATHDDAPPDPNQATATLSEATNALNTDGPAPITSSDEATRGRSIVWALYFASLGLGFIAVELVLIQRFNLFFGYPVYSLSVVLFTMLLASGAGSFWAGRFESRRLLPRALALLCALLAVYALVLPRALGAAAGASVLLRIALAVCLIAPVGLLMGMPFPTGLKRAGREAKSLVAWAWAVNGAASVFGSTLTTLIAMTYGFTYGLLAGALAYAAALLLVITLNRAPRGARSRPA